MSWTVPYIEEFPDDRIEFPMNDTCDAIFEVESSVMSDDSREQDRYRKSFDDVLDCED